MILLIYKIQMNLTLNIIEFCRSSEDVSYDYDHLSDNDKEKITNLDTVASFDFDDEQQNYVCYSLMSSNETEKWKNILDANLIPYICHDISLNVIKNNINLEKKLIKYTNNYNENSYHEFINKLNEWIKSNLDLDTVLDMINEKGVDSLRLIDKEFLKNI
jgi:hypothetical protein